MACGFAIVKNERFAENKRHYIREQTFIFFEVGGPSVFLFSWGWKLELFPLNLEIEHRQSPNREAWVSTKHIVDACWIILASVYVPDPPRKYNKWYAA